MTHDVESLIKGMSLEKFENQGNANLLLRDARDEIVPRSKVEVAHEFCKENVRKALRGAGTNGATSSEISRVTRIDIQVARRCLEELCVTREAYKLKRNRTTTIYYNNGRPRHEFGLERIEDGNTTFEISLAEGPDDMLLVHIIEKRFTLLEGEQIEGGVIVPLSQVPALMKAMENFKLMVGEPNATR